MTRPDISSPEAFEIMSERIHEAAHVLKAMASDTRLKILCALSAGELSVGELAELTNQSSSSVSQHLAKLRSAGLVKTNRDAQTIYCSCTEGVGKTVVDALSGFFY
jgi:DNA-binding transcriptional ArsR family regulator